MNSNQFLLEDDQMDDSDDEDENADYEDDNGMGRTGIFPFSQHPPLRPSDCGNDVYLSWVVLPLFDHRCDKCLLAATGDRNRATVPVDCDRATIPCVLQLAETGKALQTLHVGIDLRVLIVRIFLS
ncbi:hypothetical protein BV898_10599 [Hypsibius exemplaris]|uniref:Uncharacterized protein n=1 Tax=Hypsibius exemplaris TaxID=2072580 RepID=A0A1W0WJ30_HYPEX|nr:hypothetical protein BV898_10599 [Hypsibius exemplaris]